MRGRRLAAQSAGEPLALSGAGLVDLAGDHMVVLGYGPGAGVAQKDGVALLVGEVTALAAGVTVIGKEHLHEALLGMALVTSYFWLLWLDHTNQVFKVAAHVALHLAPRLRTVNTGALGWEAFLRKLDQGGSSALAVLYPSWPQNQEFHDLEISPTRGIVGRVSSVFGIRALPLVVQYRYLSSGPPRYGSSPPFSGRVSGHP